MTWLYINRFRKRICFTHNLLHFSCSYCAVKSKYGKHLIYLSTYVRLVSLYIFADVGLTAYSIIWNILIFFSDFNKIHAEYAYDFHCTCYMHSCEPQSVWWKIAFFFACFTSKTKSKCSTKLIFAFLCI